MAANFQEETNVKLFTFAANKFWIQPIYGRQFHANQSLQMSYFPHLLKLKYSTSM